MSTFSHSSLATPYSTMPSAFDSEGTSAVPPDGGYGWVCVVSLFLINFSTWGAVAVRAAIDSSQ